MNLLHRTAQPATLASVKIWGIYGELVVQDSPDAKLQLFFDSTKSAGCQPCFLTENNSLTPLQ